MDWSFYLGRETGRERDAPLICLAIKPGSVPPSRFPVKCRGIRMRKMKLAFSTNAYKRTTLEAAIDSIASLGYAGVEVMADVPHAYPPEMPVERVNRVREQIAGHKLAVSNVNAFTLFAIGDTYHP